MTTEERACIECGDIIPPGMECSWECYVKTEVKRGATVVSPNGLPVRCYTGFPGGDPGVFTECEGATHPDYKMPVRAIWDSEWNKTPDQYDSVEDLHAVIYSDGCIVVTLWECCFYLWHRSNGRLLHYKYLPDYIKEKHLRLSEEDLVELDRKYPNRKSKE